MLVSSRRSRNTIGFVLVLGLFATLGLRSFVRATAQGQAKGSSDDVIPIFEYDPAWPKPLPNNWMLGQVAGVAIDSKSHIWISQRPATLADGQFDDYAQREPPAAECCKSAPPVIEFDQAGNLVQAWGPVHDNKGGLLGKQQYWGPFPEIEWPRTEHGVFVDHKDNVWINSAGAPSQVLKFSRDGKLLLRIGKKHGEMPNDTENLGGPAEVVVDAKTNEVYIADGEQGRRVIVFDADTGSYKRHWGAYGKRPADVPLNTPIRNEDKYNPGSSEFTGAVHCLKVSRDGFVYAGDRNNNRVQVFRLDGTFVREATIAPQTRGQLGSVWGLGLSGDPGQRFLYVVDGSNKKLWILRRSDMKILGSFGHPGHEGGHFSSIHSMASDSQGNLYIGEVGTSDRIQRFKFMGLRSPTS